jgi:hypothetical protein
LRQYKEKPGEESNGSSGSGKKEYIAFVDKSD